MTKNGPFAFLVKLGQREKFVTNIANWLVTLHSKLVSFPQKSPFWPTLPTLAHFVNGPREVQNEPST